MNNKMNFQPEAFPLEVLTGQSEDSSEFVFEGDELEEERRGGAPFRQGFSARRRSPAQSGGARRRPRPPQRPGRLRPARPRRRWPYVAWPVGGGVTSGRRRLRTDPLGAGLSQSRVVADAPGGWHDVGCHAQRDPQLSAAAGAHADGNHGPRHRGRAEARVLGHRRTAVRRRAGAGRGCRRTERTRPATRARQATRVAETRNSSATSPTASAAASATSSIGSRAHWTTQNVIDLTASADKSQRKGTRDPKTVYALVLHQMACCFAPADPLKRFLSCRRALRDHCTTAASCSCIRCRPSCGRRTDSTSAASRWSSRATSPARAVDGGRAKNSARNRPTAAQVAAGRQLIRHLMRTMGLTHVLAHRQSSGTRENDPGPDIWFDVGQWAVNTLGFEGWRASLQDWHRESDSGGMADVGIATPGRHAQRWSPSTNWRCQRRSSRTTCGERGQYGDSGKEPTMHDTTLSVVARCGARPRRHRSEQSPSVTRLATGGFAGEMESEMSEEEEMELALELMAVSSKAELDQFLGKLLKGAWKGFKKVGSVVGKIARPLGGVLKSIAKTALPLVGGALGSFIPIPGVGTAVRSALGGAISKALEMETESLSGEDRELEIARRFVRIATAAARQAAAAPSAMDGELAANQAVTAAARKNLPRFQFDASGTTASAGAQQGRWIRHGHEVVVCSAREETPERGTRGGMAGGSSSELCGPRPLSQRQLGHRACRRHARLCRVAGRPASKVPGSMACVSAIPAGIRLSTATGSRRHAVRQCWSTATTTSAGRAVRRVASPPFAPASVAIGCRSRGCDDKGQMFVHVRQSNRLCTSAACR